jgi:hypothetical protein
MTFGTEQPSEGPRDAVQSNTNQQTSEPSLHPSCRLLGSYRWTTRLGPTKSKVALPQCRPCQTVFDDTSPCTPERGVVRLVDLCIDDHGSLVIFRSTSIRPRHLFDQNFDHDYFFKLPLQGSGMPNQVDGVSTSHHVRYRAVPRTNRTPSRANSRSNFATSSTSGLPACAPSLPWQYFCVDASPGECTDVASPDCAAQLLERPPPARSATRSCLAC